MAAAFGRGAIGPRGQQALVGEAVERDVDRATPDLASRALADHLEHARARGVVAKLQHGEKHGEFELAQRAGRLHRVYDVSTTPLMARTTEGPRTARVPEACSAMQAEFAAARPRVTAGRRRASVRPRPAARYRLLEPALYFESGRRTWPRSVRALSCLPA